MRAILNSHPDFSSYIMDDGNVMIEMLYGMYSVIDGKKAGLTPADGKVPIDIALMARSYCLSAAKNGEVIAIIEPENNNK